MDVIIRIKPGLGRILFLLLLPLLTIVSQFFQIGPVRISWLIYLIVGILVFFRLPGIMNRKVIFIMLLVIAIYPMVSYIWSISSQFEIDLYVSLITGVLFAIYIFLISEKDIKVFLSGCFLSCVVFAFWGLYEALTGHYLIFKNEDFIYRLNPFGRYYPGVAFPNTNDLAQYLAMLLPIVVMNEWDKGGNTKKGFLIITVVCSAFVIYHCYSHLGMIALAISFGFIIIRWMRKKMRKAAFWPVLIGLIAAVVYFSIKTGILELVYYNLMKVETTNVHYTGRADTYILLLRTAIKHPLGGFGNAYATDTPHNFFLYVMCDFGIVGALAIAAIIAYIIIKAYLRRNVNNLYLGIFASMIAFPLTSCISSGNEQRKIVWIVLGIGLRYALKKKDNTMLDNFLFPEIIGQRNNDYIKGI